MPYLIRQRAKIPDMRHWHHQLDMPATLTANLFLRYLYITPVTYYPLIAQTFVLTAMALIILYWTENMLAE